MPNLQIKVTGHCFFSVTVRPTPCDFLFVFLISFPLLSLSLSLILFSSLAQSEILQSDIKTRAGRGPGLCMSGSEQFLVSPLSLSLSLKPRCFHVSRPRVWPSQCYHSIYSLRVSTVCRQETQPKGLPERAGEEVQ